VNEAEGHIRPNKDFSLKEGTIHSRNTEIVRMANDVKVND